MTKQETGELLTMLSVAYPYFYSKVSAVEKRAALELWHMMFAADEYDIVQGVVVEVIKSKSDFPPTIADVEAKLIPIRQLMSGEPTYAQLWAILKKAVENGYYGYFDEFNNLPAILREYVGSAGELKRMSMMDLDEFCKWERQRFERSLPALRDRVKFVQNYPELAKHNYAGVLKDGSI